MSISSDQSPQSQMVPAPSRNKRFRGWTLVSRFIVPLAILLGVGAFTDQVAKIVANGSEVQKGIPASGEAEDAEGKVAFDETSFKLCPGPLGAQITGSIKNKTDKPIPYLQAEFALLQSSGAQMDTAITSVTDLPPNAVWVFSIPVIDKQATKFKYLRLSTKSSD